MEPLPEIYYVIDLFRIPIKDPILTFLFSFSATTAKLLLLIYTEAVLYVHMIFASSVAERFEMDTCWEVRRK